DGAGPGWICGCRISVPYIWIGYQNRPGRQQKRTWGQNAKVLAALKTLAPMEVFKNSCEIADSVCGSARILSERAKRPDHLLRPVFPPSPNPPYGQIIHPPKFGAVILAWF